MYKIGHKILFVCLLSVLEICPTSGQIVLCPRVSPCFEPGSHVIQTGLSAAEYNHELLLRLPSPKHCDYRRKLPRDLVCASEHVCRGACVDLVFSFCYVGSGNSDCQARHLISCLLSNSGWPQSQSPRSGVTGVSHHTCRKICVPRDHVPLHPLSNFAVM